MDELEEILARLRGAARGTGQFLRGGLQQYTRVKAPRTGGQVAGLLETISSVVAPRGPGGAPSPITTGLGRVRKAGLSRAERAAEELGAQDVSTAEKVGRIALGEVAPTIAEYAAGGGLARQGLSRVAPRVFAREVAEEGASRAARAGVAGREALRDAAAVLPLDAAVEMGEGTSTADAVADLTEGEGLLGQVAEMSRQSAPGRVAFGAATGLAGDLGLRTAIGGVKEGAQAARAASELAPRGRGGHVVTPGGVRAPEAADTRIHGLLDGSEELPMPEGRTTIRSLGRALEERANARYGRKLDLNEDAEQIATILADETELALSDASSAQEWYRESLERATRQVAERFPEVANDPVALDAFRFGLAVTSNGQSVRLNSRYALEVFEHFRETGRFPVRGWGKEAGAMRAHFQLFNELAEDIGSTEEVFRFLDTELSVAELRQAGLNVSGEAADEALPASVIFGPKIGGGFFRNLGGFFDEVTMDRWFRRTIGRVTGDMLDTFEPESVAQSADRFRAAIGQPDLEGDALVEAARERVKEWERIFRDAPKDDRPTKPQWALAAESVLRKSDPSVRDSPSGPAERQALRNVIRRVQDIVEERTGERHDAASIQAMLWYPEKRLYEGLGIRGGGDDIDYDTAFRELLGDEGSRSTAAAGSDLQGPRLASRESTPARAGLDDARPALRAVRAGRQRRALAGIRAADPRGERTFQRGVGGSPQALVGDVVESFRPSPGLKKALTAAKISAPDIFETSDPAAFHSAISAAKAAHPQGAAVTVYDPEDYASMRLFLTRDGKAGYALSGDDIVSVFKHPRGRQRGWSVYALTHAVGQGGRRLDAFDTVLPHLYAAAGFEPVSRVGFVDEFAPEGWNYDDWARWNGGRPDVVAMVYRPQNVEGRYTGGGQRVDDYDEMINIARAEASGQRGGTMLARPLGEAAIGAAVGAPAGEEAGVGPVAGAAAGAAVGLGVGRTIGNLGRAGHLIDPTKPGRVRGEVEVGLKGRWVSPLVSAIEGAQNAAPAEQWQGILRKAAGSREELEWTGVDEFLESRRGQRVTREELLGYLDENGLRVTETQRGGDRLDWTTGGMTGGQIRSSAGHAIDRAEDGSYTVTWQDGSKSYNFGNQLTARQFVFNQWRNETRAGGRPRYSEYSLPGGENYREVLVQLDDSTVTTPSGLPEGWTVRAADPADNYMTSVIDANGQVVDRFGASFDTAERVAAMRYRERVGFGYTSPHWDEPNVLAHLRMDDVQMGDERVLRINEIQSDWHQAGREKGYAVEKPEQYLVRNRRSGHSSPLFDSLEEAEQYWSELPQSLQLDMDLERLPRRMSSGVPDAPFKRTDDWVRLAFRRALQEAAEGGYDRIAWVSGEQAADLYDLRKQVSRIEWDEEDQLLRAFDHSDQPVIAERGVTAERLPDFIGKEPATRLLEQEPRPLQRGEVRPVEIGRMARVIDGEDLAVGGEGMETFYNRIVPNVVKKEAKRLGVGIEPVRMPGEEVSSLDWAVFDPVTGEEYSRHAIRTEAAFASDGIPGSDFAQTRITEPINLSMPLTPAARDRILNEGQRLGATTTGVARTLASGGIGAATGAAVAPEGMEAEGAVAGGLAGLGMPLILSRLRNLPARRTPEIPDTAEPAGALKAPGERSTPEAVQAAVEEAQASRARFEGDVDVADHANIASIVEDPEGVSVLGREVERVVRREGLAPKTVESHRSVRAAARQISREMGLEEGDLVLPRSKGKRGRAELVAMKDVVARNLQVISRYEREIMYGRDLTPKGPGMPLSRDELEQRQALLAAVRAQTDNILSRYIKDRTEAGRNLAAHRILANQTNDPFTWLARAQANLGAPPDRHLQAEIQRLLDEGDTEGLAQLVSGLQSSPWAEQFSALWKAGLLSAPTTHQVNIVSTAGNLALEGVKDPAAALSDRMITAALKSAAWAGAKARGHAAPQVGRTKATGVSRETLLRGLRRGAQDFSLAMRGRSTSTEAARRWDWRETTIDFVPDWLGGDSVNPILDGYQKFVFRLLGAEDKVFKAMRVEQSILDQANVVALNEGLKGQAARQRGAEIYDSWRAKGYENLPDEVALQAIADGEVATFTDKSTLSQWVGSAKAKARAMADEGSLAGNMLLLITEAAMPFTGTPSNVASRVLEYSGGGVANGVWDLSRLVRAAYTGEAVDPALQRQAAETFARGLTGGGIIALGAMLYNQGKMTLNYPGPGGEAGLWDIENKQEFSLHADGAWHSMERFSPIGNLLAVGGYMARANDRQREGGVEDPFDIALGVGAEAGFGLTSMVMSQSFLEGTNRFLTDLQRGADSESGRSRFFESTARSVVPNIVRRVAQAMDTDAQGRVRIRETDNWRDAIQSSLPILREELPLSIDALGETRTRKGAASEFVDLTYSRLDKSQLNSVRRELSRLGAPITRRRRDADESPAAFQVRSTTEGRDLYEALHQLMTYDQAYTTGAIDQAMQMARTPMQVKEFTDAIRRELIAETIARTRGRQTRERRALQGAGR